MRLNIWQVFAHDYVFKLIMAVEVIADLMDEASLAHVLVTSNMHNWARVRATWESLDYFEEFWFLAYVRKLILLHAY